MMLAIFTIDHLCNPLDFEMEKIHICDACEEAICLYIILWHPSYIQKGM